VSNSECPDYKTTPLEDKATRELSSDDFINSMGNFATATKFRINCMKSTSGFPHYKQEAYAAVDGYGTAAAIKLGGVGANYIPSALAGAKMLAADVLAHGDVSDSVAAQMRKITSDFMSLGN
jgi:hypothetical protein